MRIHQIARRRRGLVLLLGGLLWSAAWAAEPAWWTEQKRSCGLPPNLAYNSWNGVCGNTAPAPVDPGPAQRLRYQAVLQRGLVDATSFATLPVADDRDFANTLGRLYDGLARTQALANANFRRYKAKSEAELATYEAFYSPRFSKIDAADGLDPDIRSRNFAARRQHEALTAEYERVWTMREKFVNQTRAPQNAARRYREAALAAKKRVAVYFGGLSPKEVEAVVEAVSTSTPRPDCCPESPMPINLYWAQGPTTPIPHLIAVNDAEEAVATARIAALPTIGGDIETRLVAVERIAEQAAAANKSAAEWHDYYEQQVHPRTLSGARTWARIGADNMRIQEATYRLTQQAIPQAEARLKWAQDVFKSDAWEFLLNGGKAATWSIFRKKLLEPELQRIGIEYFVGRYRFSDAEVAAAWKTSKRPIFGAYSRNLNRAYDGDALKKTARNLEGKFEASALEVATVLGSAELGDLQEAGDILFMGVDDTARREVREILGRTDLPWPLRKFWEAYFTGVKPAFKENQ